MIRRYRRGSLQLAIARMLRDARESTGKSQEMFGSLIGEQARRIRRVEKGMSRPTAQLVEKWLEAAGWRFELIAGHRRHLEQVDALRVSFRVQPTPRARRAS